jgi:hypothetical protein
MLDFEGALVIELCGGLVRLAWACLSSDGGAGTGIDSSSSGGVIMDSPVLSIILSRSAPVEDLNRICSSSPSAPSGIAMPVPGVLMGKSSSSNGIGFDIVFPRTEEPMFVRLGSSNFHFPEARYWLIVPDEESPFYLWSGRTSQTS